MGDVGRRYVATAAHAHGCGSPRAGSRRPAGHASARAGGGAGHDSVAVGETFTVSVNADPAPDEEIVGFNSAVLLSDGLTWLPRPNCEGPGPDSEVQVQRQDGEPLALCVSYLTTDLQAVAHSVLSESGLATPLAVTPGATTTLIELDVQCAAPGAYDVVLLAVPDSGFGSAYANLSFLAILIKTVPFDRDGDTTPEDVGDVLTIDCGCSADSCPSPAPLLPPVLSLDTDCSPDVIRPNEDALLVCKTTVTNSGGSTAIGLRMIGVASQFYRVGLTVNGHSRRVSLFNVTEFLQVSPGQPLEIESRVVVRAENEGSYQVNLYSISIANSEWSTSDTISYDVAADADHPPTNLAISKTLLTQVDPSQPLETVEYELAVRNQSSVVMNRVTIFNQFSWLSPSVRIVATDPAATSVDEAFSLATWELGPLAPGEEVRVRETIRAFACALTESVMVVTVETEAGMEENYALVDRGLVRPSYCPPDPTSDSTGGDGFGGGSSGEDGFASDGVGGGFLVTGSSVRAPTAGAGPTASTGSPPLWAAVALAMAGVVALAVGARQTRRRER